ncbi:MAG: flagellar hook-basal body protein [Campylobacterales bacterium]|nr:flagellar hook-basal body protein [Campylobacterales bacterium]
MQNGYYDATGGMVTQFNKLNVVTNNLANLNTNGYKRDDVVIGDFKRLFQEMRDELPLENHTKPAAKFLNRALNNVPHIVEEYTSFEAGSLKQTGNTLDVALKNSDLFFAVETPGGVRYTRDGSFVLDSQGRLSTKEGHPVLPSNYFENPNYITVPEGAEVMIDNDGGLHFKMPGQAINQEPDANFLIAKFDNIKTLKKEGQNLYSNAEQGLLSTDTNSVMQGYVEKSNVNPVIEMTSLIETNRLVGMYQKAMDAQMNDVNSDAINKLGNVRG